MELPRKRERLVVAMSGASGLPYGVRILQLLQQVPEVETHLIVSAGARTAVPHELDMSVKDVTALADVVHSERNLASGLASGSCPTMGMIIAPCSVKTLSAVANCYSDNLVARAADVTLKERRPLVLMLRETPLHAGHIRLMAQATESGAVVYPPVPAFYGRAQTIEDLVDHTVRRVLTLVGIRLSEELEWPGVPPLEQGEPAPTVPLRRRQSG